MIDERPRTPPPPRIAAYATLFWSAGLPHHVFLVSSSIISTVFHFLQLINSSTRSLSSVKMLSHPKLPRIVYGTTRIAGFENKEKFFDILEQYGVHDIDTASIYVSLILHYSLNP
jgi:hypothetical protein